MMPMDTRMVLTIIAGGLVSIKSKANSKKINAAEKN